MFVSIYSMFTDSSSKDQEMKVTAFKTDLLRITEARAKWERENEEALAKGLPAKTEPESPIENVKIEPRGHNDARYIATYTSGRKIIYGEYPENLTKMLSDANIPY